MEPLHTSDKSSPKDSFSVTSIPLTHDDYVDGCFSFDFPLGTDPRVWWEIDGLKDVPGLVKEDRLEEAWAILDAGQDAFDDFDFIYAWKSLIFQKNGQFEAAGKTLTSGLTRARKKSVLCDRFALLEYETGHMDTAVQWWIRSIVAMVSTHTVTLWEPFLYLAYVARARGSETHFKILMARVTEISVHGELGLEETAVKALYEKTSRLSGLPVLKALELLCDHFLKDLEHKETAPALKTALPDLAQEAPPSFLNGRPVVFLAITGLVLLCCFLFYFFPVPPAPDPDRPEISAPHDINANIPGPEKKAAAEQTNLAREQTDTILNQTGAVPAQADTLQEQVDAIPAQADTAPKQMDASPGQADAIQEQTDAAPEQAAAPPEQADGVQDTTGATAVDRPMPVMPLQHKKKPAHIKPKTKTPRSVIKKKTDKTGSTDAYERGPENKAPVSMIRHHDRKSSFYAWARD